MVRRAPARRGAGQRGTGRCGAGQRRMAQRVRARHAVTEAASAHILPTFRLSSGHRISIMNRRCGLAPENNRSRDLFPSSNSPGSCDSSLRIASMVLHVAMPICRPSARKRIAPALLAKANGDDGWRSTRSTSRYAPSSTQDCGTVHSKRQEPGTASGLPSGPSSRIDNPMERRSWPVTRVGLNTSSASGHPRPPNWRGASGPSTPAPASGQNRAVMLNPTVCSGAALSLALSWRRASRESSSEPISPRRRSRASRHPRR